MLYVAPDVVVPFYRGASTHVFEVARGLAGLGDNVHVLSRRLDRSQPRTESSGGVSIHRIYRGIFNPMPGSKYSKVYQGERDSEGMLRHIYGAYLSTLFPLYAGLVSLQLIQKHKIQVILERETAFGAGAIASSRSGVPMVLEVVGPKYSSKSVARAEKILAYTPKMVQGVDQTRVVLVDAGVDSAKFSPDQELRVEVRRRLGIGDYEPTVGYVGTFQPWHGLDSLLTAASRLTPEFSDLRLVLVGPYSGIVREKSKSMGLDDRCLFVGPVPYEDVSDYVNACDVMVAPYDPSGSRLRTSGGIGFPLKVLEYMACGKPVVTSDIEPTNRIAGITSAALLIPPADAAALANALRSLLRDPEGARQMGLAGRALVENGYSWREFSTRLHGILEDVVSVSAGC